LRIRIASVCEGCIIIIFFKIGSSFVVVQVDADDAAGFKKYWKKWQRMMSSPPAGINCLASG
jgi:hypothetical protein